MEKKEYTDQYTYKKLNVLDGTVPRSYGIPKIHKESNPLRIIVSYINSPLATFLKEIIDRNIKKEFDYIKNSFELVK